jgi:hypothetical protein
MRVGADMEFLVSEDAAGRKSYGPLREAQLHQRFRLIRSTPPSSFKEYELRSRVEQSLN